MKKVLIIARYFIPYYHSLGGVLRALKLAEFLVQNNIQVYVLAAQGVELSYFGYEELIQKLNVVYIYDPLHYLYTKASTGKTDHANKRPPAKNKILSMAKEIIKEFSIPDLETYWTPVFYRTALKMIKNYNIPNVITTSPPHSTNIIGYRLKNKLKDKIKLFTDYRDSWNTTGLFKKHNRICRYLSERLEGKILKRTDCFVYVSPPILEKVNKKYFDISPKSMLVMNGYDANMQGSVRSTYTKNDVLTIGYFGLFHDKKGGARDPALFFEALLKFKRRIRLIFYGEIKVSEYWRARLGNTLEVKDKISHRDSLREMKTMDLLLAFHSLKEGADEVVSAKIFEYMLAERPILIIGPSDMEAAKIVEKDRLGYTIDLYNENDMLEKLTAIYTLWDKNELLSYSLKDLTVYSRQYQYSKLLGLLK